MEKQLSIIIPVYNVAGYLETCLSSIKKQTWKDFEVIIVDDGSTDESPAICDCFCKEDNRFRVIHKKNEGVSKARNTGIDVATGKYFLFFDSDDFVEPYACEELIKMAEEKKADTVIYGYHRYKDGKVWETNYPKFDQDFYIGDEIIDQVLPRFIGLSNKSVNRFIANEEGALFVENPALWRTLVSGELIRDNNIRFNENLKVGEDTIFISEYLSYAERCYIHRKCYYYLVTRETSTIYQYELDPVAKLEGKLRLLDARNELTDRINKQKQVSIDHCWRGTIIMSCMELAFLFSKKNNKLSFRKRYQLFLSYINNKEVKDTIKSFDLKFRLGIKLIPFELLKKKLYFLLFLAVSMLQLVHYEFQRN
ncbi:MAG: glycosyltransferase family 2 protein [bacterium]|nr:glycosyltransferase family 2 protein [bacterium]